MKTQLSLTTFIYNIFTKVVSIACSRPACHPAECIPMGHHMLVQDVAISIGSHTCVDETKSVLPLYEITPRRKVTVLGALTLALDVVAEPASDSSVNMKHENDFRQ